MNKAEVIQRISAMSEVDMSDCEKVINALEKVLEDEFESSQGLLNALDKSYKLINLFRKK